MVHIEKKVIEGKTYLYLSIRAKVDGKSKRVWQKYLGPEEAFQKKGEALKLQLSKNFEITTKELGFELALWQISEELQLATIIDQLSNKRAQGIPLSHYLILSAINRIIKPRSKHQLGSWLESSYLKTLMPSIDETYTNRLSMAYTNHFQYLTEELMNKVQQKLCFQLLHKYGVKMDQLFYDPTNFYSYINPKEQDLLARHGKSKEGRHILNLIALSVVCTNDGGFPLFHQIYPGNIQDAEHFKTQHQRILEHLQQLKLDPSEVTLVFDKGNSSEASFQGIDAAGLQFICSVRPSSHKDLHDLAADDFKPIKLPNGKEVGIKEYTRKFHSKNRRLIVCYDGKRAEWNKHNKLHKILKKIDDVNTWFESRLNTHKWKSKETVESKITSLIGKTYLPYVKYWVEQSIDGQICYTLQLDDQYFDSEVAKLGKSYLMTSYGVDDKKAEEIVWLFRQQFTVEKLFSYLKEHPQAVSIRPIFHHRDSSIRGHIFICMLGVLLLLILKRKINEYFPELELEELRNGLEEIKMAYIVFNENDVREKVVKNSKLAKQLFDKLQMEKYMISKTRLERDE
jgi:transposase